MSQASKTLHNSRSFSGPPKIPKEITSEKPAPCLHAIKIENKEYKVTIRHLIRPPKAIRQTNQRIFPPKIKY